MLPDIVDDKTHPVMHSDAHKSVVVRVNAYESAGRVEGSAGTDGSGLGAYSSHHRDAVQPRRTSRSSSCPELYHE